MTDSRKVENDTIPVYKIKSLLLTHHPVHSIKQLLHSKLPRLIHKHSDDILTRARNIALKHKMVTNNYNATSILNVYLWPYTNNIDMLVDIMGFVDWGWFVDDACLKWKHISGMNAFSQSRMKKAWLYGTKTTSQDCDDTDLIIACEFACYLRDRLLKSMPPHFYFVFIKSMYKWYNLKLNINDNVNVQCKIRSSDDLLEIKPALSGMTVSLRPTTQIINKWYYKIDENLALLGYNEFSAKLKEFEKSIALSIGLLNDLFSFPKETIDDDLDGNILRYNTVETNYQLTKAINNILLISNDMYKKCTILYTELLNDVENLDKLEKNTVNNFKQYINDINHSCSAHYHFHVDSSRYKHQHHIFTDMIAKNTARSRL